MKGHSAFPVAPALTLFPGPLWTGVGEPDRILSSGLIELFDI